MVRFLFNEMRSVFRIVYDIVNDLINVYDRNEALNEINKMNMVIL